MSAALIDSTTAASLISDLVAIDSINPSLIPGAAGEVEIAHYVANYLERAGLAVWEQTVAPGRINTIGLLHGRGGGRSLILNAHMDTVGVAGMDDPFTPRIEGDRLYGRGAFDMKGGLAAIMLAATELAHGPHLAGDVIVMAVADEEYASLGTEAALAAVRADAAIVTEPTGLDICIAHKGFAWLEIETIGRAAHGSRPDLGVDAIAAMGEVLSELNALNRKLASSSTHPLLGSPSLHTSLIRGGQELSSYPASCLLHIERRTLPGETREQIAAELAAVLETVAAHDPQFNATGRVFFWRDPFAIEPEAEIVRALVESAQQVAGCEPALVGQTPWMDAALLQAADIPTVVYGPGGEGAHAIEEWVSISQVATCAEVLVHVTQRFCT
jgi:acetylornithine deacetylase